MRPRSDIDLEVRGGAVPRRDSRRGGFTLVELMIVAAIVGILAGLAIPNLRTQLYRARAVEIHGDMEVVKVATLSFNADRHSWPGEAAVGEIPTGLTDFLPEGYGFVREGYQLDYENWPMPSGLPGDPSASLMIGVSVNIDDVELSNALYEFMGSSILFTVGTKHTILIDRS